MRRIVLYMQQTLDGKGADPADTMEWANVTPQTWDLVDELTATCDTAVIGEGAALLADPLDLRLLEARPLESGVVVLHHAVEHEEAR